MIEREFPLPHGYRATFIWSADAGMEVKWLPSPPVIRAPRAQRRFFAAYCAARTTFMTEVAHLVGGKVLIADVNGRTEVVAPPTVQ